jgi:hypothetical protein
LVSAFAFFQNRAIEEHVDWSTTLGISNFQWSGGHCPRWIAPVSCPGGRCPPYKSLVVGQRVCVFPKSGLEEHVDWSTRLGISNFQLSGGHCPRWIAPVSCPGGRCPPYKSLVVGQRICVFPKSGLGEHVDWSTRLGFSNSVPGVGGRTRERSARRRRAIARNRLVQQLQQCADVLQTNFVTARGCKSLAGHFLTRGVSP